MHCISFCFAHDHIHILAVRTLEYENACKLYCRIEAESLLQAHRSRADQAASQHAPPSPELGLCSRECKEKTVTNSFWLADVQWLLPECHGTPCRRQIPPCRSLTKWLLREHCPTVGPHKKKTQSWAVISLRLELRR